MYYENKRGNVVGYFKFEIFLVWNVFVKYFLNIVYEVVIVDLKDVNMIDLFYFEMYGEMLVNYNRDLELFLVFKKIIEKIIGKELIF